MITLMTFAACDTQPSHSPYCVKAMCLLEMAGQKWRREDLKMPSKAPLGKLPVLRVGDRLIPDTEFIQHWLEEQGADFHVGLDAVQRAHSHGIVRMVEGSIGLAQAQLAVIAVWRCV